RESGIALHLFTDTPSPRADLDSGRLTPELLERVVPDAASRETYACAPLVVVDTARDALTALGLPAERFHTESFTAPELERPADDGIRSPVRFSSTGPAVQSDG